jgi:hypothetical protein
MNNLYQTLSEKYPFLSHIEYGGNDYIGIVQNRDNYITSLYSFEQIKSDELKVKFLELGEVWWWESNRMIPINIFLKKEWDVFRVYLLTFNNKDLNIIFGPYVSLSELSQKRTKKRSIQLVRRLQ